MANITLNGVKLKISSEIRDKTRMSTLTTFIQHSFGCLSHSNQRRKTKGTQIGKEEVKPSLFAGDVLLCTENPKDITRKSVDLINESGKVAGYKISTEKTVAFQDVNDKRSGELEQTIPCTITSKRIKYLGMNLPKDAKDRYLENC